MPEQNSLIERYAKAPYLLVQKFSQDYDALMLLYTLDMKIEITRHLEKLMTLFRDEPETCFEKINKAEVDFYEKYGSTLKPYRDAQFYKYFNAELVLSEKDIFSAEEWNQLPPELQSFAPEMTEKFKLFCLTQLTMARQFLYLDRQIGSPDNFPEKSGSTANHNGVTRSRQLLAIYFLLKANGIEHRVNVSGTDIARLVNLFSNIPCPDTIQNSEIYKMYLKMPEYKEKKNLLADLTFIRPFFEGVSHTGVLELIDAAMADLK